MKWLLILVLAVAFCFGQRQREPKPEPAFADVSYGSHERNVLDFWKAESATPVPLVIYIHGGGFRGGSKNNLPAGTLKPLLAAGISVAAIHYRLVPKDPLPAAHEDAVRALQFLRSKAGAWNIDKTKAGAFGGSAGAQLCMYMAFHDELAKPNSADPVERESSRLSFVAASGGQTTMDFKWWFKHIPEYTEPHRPMAEYFGERPRAELDRLIRDVSALSLISADDPPIHMSHAMAPSDPVPADPAKVQNWKVHHVNFGVALKEKMDVLGVEADLKYRGAESTYQSVADFFITKFGK